MMWYRMPARLTGLCAMICKTGVFTFLIMNIFNIHNIREVRGAAPHLAPEQLLFPF